jgi:hypothetical protein
MMQATSHTRKRHLLKATALMPTGHLHMLVYLVGQLKCRAILLFLFLVLALAFLMFVVAKLACVAVSASATGEEAASLASALRVGL